MFALIKPVKQSNSVRTQKYTDRQNFQTIAPATTLIPFETGISQINLLSQRQLEKNMLSYDLFKYASPNEEDFLLLFSPPFQLLQAQ